MGTMYAVVQLGYTALSSACVTPEDAIEEAQEWFGDDDDAPADYTGRHNDGDVVVIDSDDNIWNEYVNADGTARS